MRITTGRSTVFVFALFTGLVLALGLGASMSLAQVTRATISGVVSDPTGAAIPKATVTATNVETQEKRTAVSSTDGNYTLTEVDPGSYTITVTAPGFATLEERGIKVDVAARLGMNFQLEVGKTSTIVEVTSAAPMIETTNSTISDVVTAEKVVDLPLNGRDVYALVSLEPGVVPGPCYRGECVDSNGQREASANYMLDGADNNDVGVTGWNTAVALDDVAEYRVLTNNFSAEFGRNTGFIADTITKSGTNSFHGVGWDFVRNNIFDAASFVNNYTGTPKDILRRNQYGGNVGGPILKDKTFFFGSFESTLVRPGNVLYGATVPTANFINSLPASSFAKQILTKYVPPAPNAGGYANSLGGRTCGSPPVPCDASNADEGLVQYPTVATKQNTYYVTGKIDENINPANRLTGAFHYERDRFPYEGNVSPYPAFDTPYVGDDRNFSLNYTHTFSPTIVNEARAGLNRALSNYPWPTSTTFPGMSEDLTGAALPSENDNLPQDFTENTIFASDLLTITRGKSTYKIGGDYRRIRNGSTFGAYEYGYYEFDSLGTPAGAPPDCASNDPTAAGCSFAQDAPYVAVQSLNPSISTPTLPEYYRGYRQNEMALFFQDDIKVTRKLTLNAGLRWEYFGPPHNFRRAVDYTALFGTGANIYERIAGEYTSQVINNPGDLKNVVWHKQFKNFAPRLGFAYDPFGNGKTAIRGGFGINYDRLFNNVFENIRFNPPDFCFCEFSPITAFGLPPFNYEPFDPVSGLSSISSTGAELRHMDQNMKTSYGENFFFGIERQIAPETVLTVNYVGTGGVKLYTINNINRVNSEYWLDPSCYVAATGTDNCGRLNNNFGDDNFRSNDAHSTYSGLQVEVIHRYKNGMAWQASYTWGHAITNFSDAFYNGPTGSIDFTQAFNPSLDKGNADFDTRHSLVFNYNYELPFYRSQVGLVGHVLGGWTLNGITYYRTGNPFTVIETDDPNEDSVKNDRVNVVAGVPWKGGYARTAPNGSPIPGGVQFVNVSAFSAVTPAFNTAAGTESQGEFHTPGSWNWDIGVHKDISISKVREGLKLEYRVEFFDAFNHANLGGPNQNFDSGTFGQATYGGQRLIQMALKLYF
jgi:hypothetical protein